MSSKSKHWGSCANQKGILIPNTYIWGNHKNTCTSLARKIDNMKYGEKTGQTQMYRTCLLWGKKKKKNLWGQLSGWSATLVWHKGKSKAHYPNRTKTFLFERALWGNNTVSKSIVFSHVCCAYALSAKESNNQQCLILWSFALCGYVNPGPGFN